MDDETPRLRTLLEELHGELSRPSSADMDETRRTQLLDLKADIERLLARREGSTTADAGEAIAAPAVPPEERQNLQHRLQSLVAGFEGAHPQIASALEQTMNALSNMGL